MPRANLPERPSLEYLKKLAKDRLHELRRTEPHTKLADALLAVARDHGFPSWRALKAEIDRRLADEAMKFFEACKSGDEQILRDLLAHDPELVRAARPGAPHGGWTGLHEAAGRGQLQAVRLLLEHGADPNAREAGDNTTPLHWAAAKADLDIMRTLLEAGSDVHGFGDVHEQDTIGWAVTFGNPPDQAHLDAAALLVSRGARHHIFSAIAINDLSLIQALVERDPHALDRRMSRFEQRQTPMHFALSHQRYDIVSLLIELGADLEAVDAHGHTPLETAMLRGDREAMSRLHAAGAAMPQPLHASEGRTQIKEEMQRLAPSIAKGVPMITVADVGRTLDWYVGIGFTEIARYEDDGVVNFGMLKFGNAELMLNIYGKPGRHDVSLWFYTDRVDELYQLLKTRQLTAVQAAIAGAPGAGQGIEFQQEIEDMFYGARQFGIRDLNGYELFFIKSLD